MTVSAKPDYYATSMRVSRESLLSQFEQLRMATSVIRQEADSLNRLANSLPVDFCAAVELMLNCRGVVMVTGVGKAGWIGQKISASLASTGTLSHFLHPAEAMHGDLGRIRAGDVILVLSNSGETAEVTDLLPSFKSLGAKVVAVTGRTESKLAKHADLTLTYGETTEACPLGLAPSTSTTTMLAMGDALTLVVAKMRSFQSTDFAKFHPGGSLGKKLARVEDVMRSIDDCRVAQENETVREIYVRSGAENRRAGVVLVVNGAGCLTGIFTDSDLARLLGRQKDTDFDSPIAEVMTTSPVTVSVGTKATVAIETLASRNLSELPVVDDAGALKGLVDITDVVGW
jgi:arabinose-5-phosphate isomerase